MQIVHDLLQVFFGFVLASNIAEMDALRRLYIDLGVGFSGGTEHHGVFAACLFHQFFAHILADADKNEQRQYCRGQKADDGGSGFLYLFRKGCTCIVQPLGQGRVIHRARLINSGVVLIGKYDAVILDLHTADVLIIDHGHKGSVVYIRDLPSEQQRRDQQIE